jgi:predicted nucleic acid-binding protein
VNTVFLDTVGLIALWDRADQWHGVAEQAYRKAKAANCEFCSTSYVLLECGNAASRRPYRDRVVQMMRRLEADQALHAY